MITRAIGWPPVLMYHGVGTVTEDPFGLYVSPDRFAQQMRTLRVLGLRGVSFGELGDAQERDEAEGLVGLTFDDGYRDVIPSAAPTLERYGFTATMFAVSGLLSGENFWDPPPRRTLVNEADLQGLVARGWEIGAHSVTHARLTELKTDRLRDEVCSSRAALAEVTGMQPRSFCYPYGAVDAEAVDAVREAGYTYAAAVWRVPGLPITFARPRIGVTQRDWTARLIAKLFLRGR